MELINAEIVAITNAYKKGTNFKLPPAAAWKRRVNMSELLKARELIDTAIREVLEVYFDEEHSDPDGDGRTIKKEYQKEALKKQTEILSQSTDVKIKKVKVEDLGNDMLSDDDMDSLAFMIEDEE